MRKFPGLKCELCIPAQSGAQAKAIARWRFAVACLFRGGVSWDVTNLILVEHDGLISIEEHPIFQVPANRSRENNFLQVRSFLAKTLDGIHVGNPVNVR